MKSTETQSERKNGSSTAARFLPVKDSRNRRVPGLYVRNGRYYGQLWVSREDGTKTARKFPLLTADEKPAETLNEAKEAMEVARHLRREDALPTVGLKPTLAQFTETYFTLPEVMKKKPATLRSEREALARWNAFMGSTRLDRIKASQILDFMGQRTKDGISIHTRNLHRIALRNLLKAAVARSVIKSFPAFKGEKEPDRQKRDIISTADFERLLAATATACRKNGQQMRDYLEFLAYSGAREKEALRVTWADVDFQKEKLTIGADGLSKNGLARTVDFNPKLAALLTAMHARRAPDSRWLFPSPQRGQRDEHAITFRDSFKLVRAKARLPRLGFHDLRHYFCSKAVMAGIDFMTIAEWAGHKDGGILIGKVYGHTEDDHRRKAAAKLAF